MLLVYCRLYITYTLVGFLFDLDQRVTFVAGTFKRLNIEYGKTMPTYPSEDIQHNKKAENTRRSRHIFLDLWLT